MIIGIDPGKQTGFAIFGAGEFKMIATLDFWSAFSAVSLYPPEVVHQVIIEVPDTKHVWQKAAATTKSLQRQGVNVGSVIREAELLAGGIERYGYKVKRVNPRKKVDAKTFREYTGYTGSTNQHERDAAMLCYRRPRDA